MKYVCVTLLLVVTGSIYLEVNGSLLNIAPTDNVPACETHVQDVIWKAKCVVIGEYEGTTKAKDGSFVHILNIAKEEDVLKGNANVGKVYIKQPKGTSVTLTVPNKYVFAGSNPKDIVFEDDAKSAKGYVFLQCDFFGLLNPNYELARVGIKKIIDTPPKKKCEVKKEDDKDESKKKCAYPEGLFKCYNENAVCKRDGNGCHSHCKWVFPKGKPSCAE